MNGNGMTMVPRKRFGDRYFVIRFRWVDPVLWKRLSDQLPQMTPFATAGEMAVNHCPGCGTKLSDWIQQNQGEFEELCDQVVD
jgi:hypothetical protein